MIVATIDEPELSAFAEATADRPILWSLAAVLSPLPCEGRVRVQRFAQPVVWNPSPQSSPLSGVRGEANLAKAIHIVARECSASISRELLRSRQRRLRLRPWRCLHLPAACFR